MKAFRIGIIAVPILLSCVNLCQSIVICDPKISIFKTADEDRKTQINADELDKFRLQRA